MSISTIPTGCGIYFHHAVVHLAISYRYSITRRIWLAHPYLEKKNGWSKSSYTMHVAIGLFQNHRWLLHWKRRNSSTTKLVSENEVRSIDPQQYNTLHAQIQSRKTDTKMDTGYNLHHVLSLKHRQGSGWWPTKIVQLVSWWRCTS